MRSGEPIRRVVTLGSAAVAVACPDNLLPWFPGLCDVGRPTVGRTVEVCRADDATFRVIAAGEVATARSLGDAIARAWERITFLLCDGLTGAAAIHGAAVSRGGGVVLLPGASGVGKTRLALWLRTRGFDLGTDELATVAAAVGCATSLAVSALGRPVVVKGRADLAGLLRPAEAVGAASVPSAMGRLVALEPSWSRIDAERTLIVFPRFSAGAPLSLRPLSQGEAALQLMASCINSRNLSKGGLSATAGIARHASAVALNYGDTRQLDGTLDELTDRMLGAQAPEPSHLAALCAALQARGSAARAATTPAPLSAPAVLPAPRRLTVGMATYDDYDGAYFTVQALRTYHPELRDDVEIVIVDNNPDGICAEPLRRLMAATEGGRYVARGEWSGTAVKNAVFEEAGSPSVVCLDSHVLLAPGSLAALLMLLESDEHRRDLIQGPLVRDDLKTLATHLDPGWSAGMYGVWGNDPRGSDPDGPAFDIGMQGTGLFAARRDAWAGFNPRFRGWGGEEFYIHEKTRRRGGRTLCLPRLRWLHRFSRPRGIPYPFHNQDRVRNYVIGFDELGLDTCEMEKYFAETLGAEATADIFARARAEVRMPSGLQQSHAVASA